MNVWQILIRVIKQFNKCFLSNMHTYFCQLAIAISFNFKPWFQLSWNWLSIWSTRISLALLKNLTGELLWNADHLLKWKSFWLAYYPIYPVVGEGLRLKAVYCTNSPAVSPPRNRFQDPGQLSPAPTVTVHRCAFIKTYIRAVIGNRWHIFT